METTSESALGLVVGELDRDSDLVCCTFSPAGRELLVRAIALMYFQVFSLWFSSLIKYTQTLC